MFLGISTVKIKLKTIAPQEAEKEAYAYATRSKGNPPILQPNFTLPEYMVLQKSTPKLQRLYSYEDNRGIASSCIALSDSVPVEMRIVVHLKYIYTKLNVNL